MRSRGDLGDVQGQGDHAAVGRCCGHAARPEPAPRRPDSCRLHHPGGARGRARRSRLRRDDLVSVAPGLWALRDRVVTERDIVGALCRRDPEAFAAGLTAARIWGLPLPGVLADAVTEAPRQSRVVDGRTTYRPARNSVDGRMHMARGDSRPRESALVRWSLLDAPVVRLVDRRDRAPGVRLTTRLRTFLDLGPQISLEALVAIGDHLVRRPRPRFELSPR